MNNINIFFIFILFSIVPMHGMKHGESDKAYPNVLWRILGDEYSSDCMKRHLENGVDATKLYTPKSLYSSEKQESMCLLHYIPYITSDMNQHRFSNVDLLLEKVTYLLDAMPKDMVNSLHKKRTPIDIAQDMRCPHWSRDLLFIKFYEKLICLYRKYGGLSSFALNKKLIAQAGEYNQVHSVWSVLPQEIIFDILSCCQKPGELCHNSIKNYMQLRGVCKKLNQLCSYKAIGELCKGYAQDVKNKALEKVVGSLYWILEDRANKRFVTLVLICAGADPNIKADYYCNSKSLLECAVCENDLQMVKTLLEHKADLNVRNLAAYKTKEMAQLFIDNGVDVHVSVDDYPNVLWRVVEDKYPADLLKFYLAKGVDPRQLSCRDYFGSKQDLLCYVTDGVRDSYGDYHRDNIKKAKLLLKAMPEKVNTVWGWRTLIDIVHDKHGLCKTSEYGHNRCCHSCEEFIALFRKHGGLTAEELELQAVQK